jgi:hypothetical protein
LNVENIFTQSAGVGDSGRPVVHRGFGCITEILNGFVFSGIEEFDFDAIRSDFMALKQDRAKGIPVRLDWADLVIP